MIAAPNRFALHLPRYALLLSIIVVNFCFASSLLAEASVYRINSGGGGFTDGLGNVYGADQYFGGGNTYVVSNPIDGTADDPLYQSERFGNFSYALPVPNGNYTVVLKFAEIYWDQAGKRVFSVLLEGQQAIGNLDIFALVGKNRAYDVSLPVSVTDGVLNISFQSIVDYAKVSAIEVKEGQAPSPFSSTRIMPLGDSITDGVGSSDSSGHRRFLYHLLTRYGYSFQFVGTQSGGPYDFGRSHEGHGGYDSQDILQNIYQQGANWLGTQPADIILLHIGTNDVHSTSLTNSIANIEGILNKIGQFGVDNGKQVTVIIARIILRFPTDPWYDETIAFNSALETMVLNRIAGGDKVVLVDMQEALRYPDDLNDTLHPNDIGYNKMAEVWFDAITAVIPSTGGFSKQYIPQDGWSVAGVSSETTGALARNAIDGKPETIWLTQNGLPQEIQIDLGNTYYVDGLRYLPRQNVSIGRIRDYDIYVGIDGSTWGQAVAEGVFINSNSEQAVNFSKVLGRYMRLVGLSEVLGDSLISAAEINLTQSNIAEYNYFPNGSILKPFKNLTIFAGDYIDFSGKGSDSDQDLPLTYRWSLGAGSGINDVLLEDPGPVQFGRAGVFEVQFLVCDNSGACDPHPAKRTITVLERSSGNTIYLLNSGGGQYTDGQGNVYGADQYFSGGYTYAVSDPIAGTTDDALYQSERFGNFSYALPLANGNYTVVLKFAEIYWNQAGKRVFNVLVDGQLAIGSLDIFALVGKNRAYDVSLPVSVTDGVLNITFQSVVDYSKVSAIVVRPLTLPSDYRLNSGGGQYTDGQGNVYGADEYFSGGYTYAVSNPIAGTTDDALYQNERFGNFSYALPLANGNYTVVLKFAEIYWDQPGKRVFNVLVDGQLAIGSLDIFALVGKNRAYDVSLPVSVTDGVLNIAFQTIVDNAKVSAIEVAPR